VRDHHKMRRNRGADVNVQVSQLQADEHRLV
jgi:hypothetical protein